MKTLTPDTAWALCKQAGKIPPYRGYGLFLEDKGFLSHNKNGVWRLFDSPQEAQAFAHTPDPGEKMA